MLRDRPIRRPWCSEYFLLINPLKQVFAILLENEKNIKERAKLKILGMVSKSMEHRKVRGVIAKNNNSLAIFLTTNP